ncbi:MAG: RtcB family protein [Candidatus Diapherotrites archaeon]|nr:RtcB family protein [Candidatus Diapherotrites archaeon]
MRVNAKIYASEDMVKDLIEEEKSQESTIRQLKNVACLPGIMKNAIALADCHPGYGAPIGSVAAMDLNDGVIAFGLIGFDINCGVRTLKTSLSLEDIEKKKGVLAEAIFEGIPAGLGSKGTIKFSINELDEILAKGAKYVVEKGYGFMDDLDYIEMKGCAKNALPDAVSIRAKQRQHMEIGTLGSGNHYIEVQYVSKIFDIELAKDFGLFQNQVLVSIHSGSRALGHQIGMDYINILRRATEKYKIKILDKELVNAPIESEEGKSYLGAVNAGINCAFANRQVLGHLTRCILAKKLGVSEKEITVLYDVGHNTAKIEKHEVDGSEMELLVQRKGSTRGFGPGHEELPPNYRRAGQPILVGGTMGTASYILAGTEKGMLECFGSSVHGAGRKMSRTAAIKSFKGTKIIADLRQNGIILKAHSMEGAAEEAPQAYKDIDVVVNIMHNAGISKKVAQLRPLISVKG